MRGLYNMIKYGDRPDTDPKSNEGYNKYIGLRGDGFRGKLIAVNSTGDQGIIDTGGSLILVKEDNPNEYPIESKDKIDITKFSPIKGEYILV